MLLLVVVLFCSVRTSIRTLHTQVGPQQQVIAGEEQYRELTCTETCNIRKELDENQSRSVVCIEETRFGGRVWCVIRVCLVVVGNRTQKCCASAGGWGGGRDFVTHGD